MVEMLRQLNIIGPKPKFKKGDTVRRREGHELMIVVWVDVSAKTKVVSYLCKWFDRHLQATRTNLFLENELTVFDWSID
ncbi:MAG TPA: hypothetical protein VD816_02725 [Ohtaekwangia sp.]|nr:hypothetical protein [Ohtaekwangia sp.]